MENEFVSQQEVNPNEVQNEAPSWSNMETPPETETDSAAETDKSNNETTVDTANRQESPDNNMPNDADSPETPVQDNREQDVERARAMAKAEDFWRTTIKDDFKGRQNYLYDENIVAYKNMLKRAADEAEEAGREYDKKELASKIIRGEKLTQDEEKLLAEITESEQQRKERKKQENELEKERERNAELAKEREKELEKERIEKEISEIVEDDSHPYHEEYTKNYRSYMESRRERYDRLKSDLANRADSIRQGKEPYSYTTSYEDDELIEEINSIKENAKMYAYNRVKRLEKLEEAIGRKTSKVAKKPSIFERIMGKK